MNSYCIIIISYNRFSQYVLYFNLEIYLSTSKVFFYNLKNVGAYQYWIFESYKSLTLMKLIFTYLKFFSEKRHIYLSRYVLFCSITFKLSKLINTILASIFVFSGLLHHFIKKHKSYIFLQHAWFKTSLALTRDRAERHDF